MDTLSQKKSKTKDEKIYYQTHVIEPAVVRSFNKAYYFSKKLHAVQLYAPVSETNNKNAYDVLLHRDFQVTDFSNGKVSFYDVKTVEPENDRNERTNFSISKTCEGLSTLDYFVFVYRDICYICKYNDVISNLHASNKPYEYNLIALSKIKQFYKSKFPFSLEN